MVLIQTRKPFDVFQIEFSRIRVFSMKWFSRIRVFSMKWFSTEFDSNLTHF